MMSRPLALSILLALAAPAPPANAYVLWGASLTGDTHIFYIDVTAPLCALPPGVCGACTPGAVQDWVGATILAAQAWSDPLVAGANFRYVFGGFIAPSPTPPDYPPNVNVVTLGQACIGYPGNLTAGPGFFHTCMFADIPFDVSGSPPSPGLCFDLQGSTVHQLGHALGLAHSLVPGASMFTQSVNALEWRDLHPDDIAGVQAIYGPLAPNTPVLDYAGVPFTGATITIRLLNAVGGSAIAFDTSPGPAFIPGIGQVHVGLTPNLFVITKVAPNAFPMPIPPSPAIAGATYYMHALTFAPGVGLVASNPSRIHIPY